MNSRQTDQTITALLQTGFYTEVLFREKGVRFIAVANGVDSADKTSGEFTPFLNITVKRTDNVDAANPLTGLVYCAECGGKMYNHRSRSRADRERRGLDPVTGLYPYDHYDCSTYSRTITHTEKKCSSHYITTRALRALVLDAIREASAYALSDREAFTRQVREASEIRQREATRDLMPPGRCGRNATRCCPPIMNGNRRSWRRPSRRAKRSWPSMTATPTGRSSFWHWRGSTRTLPN